MVVTVTSGYTNGKLTLPDFWQMFNKRSFVGKLEKDGNMCMRNR